MGTQLPTPKREQSPSPILVPFLLSPNGWHIKMPLGMEVGLSPGDFVLDGDPAPPQKGVELPIFGPCLLWPNGMMDQDATRYRGSPQPRRHCVRWGPNSPSPKPVRQFSAHVCCGQTAGWIKMARGMEVGLGPGHIVLDGHFAPLLKTGDRAPNFRPISVWSNGWMDQDATWYGGRPRPK